MSITTKTGRQKRADEFALLMASRVEVWEQSSIVCCGNWIKFQQCPSVGSSPTCLSDFSANLWEVLRATDLYLWEVFQDVRQVKRVHPLTDAVLPPGGQKLHCNLAPHVKQLRCVSLIIYHCPMVFPAPGCRNTGVCRTLDELATHIWVATLVRNHLVWWLTLRF